MEHLEEVRLHYARQLQRWGTAGGRSIKTELLQVPAAANGGTALVRAEAMGRSGRSVGYGSADARLAGTSDPGRLLECAELLAKIDSLAESLKTMQSASGEASARRTTTPRPLGRRAILPFSIPADAIVRQQLDLKSPPQGEGARIYLYFHQLIQQMKQHSRQLRETDLGLLDQVAEFKHDVSFYTHPQALVMVSHAIEDEFVQKQLAQPFYAGFQYFSRARPQEPRYRAILHSAQRVVVFGLADLSLWFEPRLEAVPIAQGVTGLERFWFVATTGPDWTSALLAEHFDGTFSKSLTRRHYEGFWTFDPVIVERIIGTLDYARTLMPGAPQD